MKKISILFCCIAFSLQAQQVQKQPTLSVSGEGIVHVIPDEAVINIRVEHTGTTAKEVKMKNDAVVDAILKFCKTSKIAKKDVNTQYINLNKNYDYQQKKYHYKANQAISILLRDLDTYEAVIQGLLDSGANRIDGVSFKSSKFETYQSEARIKAIQQAKQKAEEYAGALQQNIGKAIHISENMAHNNPAPILRSYNEMAASTLPADRETIAIGEMKISTKVQVVFELQ